MNSFFKTYAGQIAEYTYDWESLIAPDGTLLWVNRSVTPVTGYTPDECYGMQNYPLPFVHPSDYEWMQQFLSRLSPEYRQNDKEIRFISKGGKTVYTALSWQPMPDLEGNWLGTRTSIREISHRKTIEDLTRLTEQFYRTLFEESADMIIICTADGRVLDCNTKTIDTLGYSRDTLLHYYIDDITEDDSNFRKERINQTAASNSVLFTTNLLHKDGNTIPVEIQLQKLRYGYTDVLAAFVRNITERKKIQDNLINTSKELEKALKIKTDFISTLSHEIRTPLNSIISLNHLLKESPLTPAQKQYLNRMDNSSRLLMDMINNMLDLSKIESGRFSIAPETFILDDLIDRILGSFASLASQKGIALYHVRDPETPFSIITDQLRLEQVLINILSNAVKFTEQGSITLSNRFYYSTTGRPVINFQITDTGIGIEKNDIKNLFEPFYQADSSLNRPYPGTGLGLSISAQIIKLLGGGISVDSQKGRGSTFSFTIKPELHDTSFVYPYSDTSFQSLTVYLGAADDEKIHSALTYHLKMMGCTVKNLQNLHEDNTDKPSLLICKVSDMHLCRQEIETDSVSLILIQYSADVPDREFEDIPVLGAPFSPRELSTVIKTVMDFKNIRKAKEKKRNSYPSAIPQKSEDSPPSPYINHRDIQDGLQKLYSSLYQDLNQANLHLDAVIESAGTEMTGELTEIKELLSRYKIEETADKIREFARFHAILLQHEPKKQG